MSLRRRTPAGDGGEASTPVRDPYDQALRLLAGRAHFRRELEHKLRARGHDPDAVATALDRVAAEGYLDDTATARSLAAERVRHRDGRNRIAATLARRGAGNEAVTAALGELPADETATAREVAAAWLRRTSERRRTAPALARHLAARGFGSGTVRRVLDELGLPAVVPDE